MASGEGDEAASDRDLTADDRDRAADLRDRGAEDRDAAARRYDRSVSGEVQRAVDIEVEPDSVHRQRLLARDESSRDRVRSAEDRDEAAVDREEAARGRTEALHDRTDAELAAQRALETLESMSDAFLTLDSEWRFTYLNPQTEAILDRPRDDLLGKNMWEEFPEAVGSGFEDAYRRALEGQVGVRFEERYEPLGRILEIRVYPIPDGLAVYFSDVTGDRMRDAKQKQTQRLEVLGQVTAGVAHDFNNLLAAIAGFAELGKVDVADPEKAGLYFHQIASASKKATALTRQLLSFAREQALAPTLFDLNEAVEELSPLLIQLLPSSIALLLELAPDPVVVYADRSEVEQAVINLVVNGRDAIYGPGAVTIATTSDPSAERLDPDAQRGAGHGGWLQVADTGSGIPEHVLPFIFDPYFSTKSAELGTGLGLATIYGIVSQSGGSIHVDSTVGVGTAMTVALPGGPPAPPSP